MKIIEEVKSSTINNLLQLTGFHEVNHPVGHLQNIRTEYYAPWLYSYKTNSNGFRSLEFSDEIELVVLGCSHTYGVGLAHEHIWPSVFSELIGVKKFANLAKSGSSICEQIRYLNLFIHKYGAPKIIVCNFPAFNRYETVNKHGESVQGSMIDSGYKHFSMEPASVIHQNMQAVLSLESLCKAAKIKLAWQFWASTNDLLVESYTSSSSSSSYVHYQDTYYWDGLNRAVSFDKKTQERKFDETYIKEKTCCSDLLQETKKCFDFAFDRFNIPKEYIKNPSFFSREDVEILMDSTDPLFMEKDRPLPGHLGSHAHRHWAKNLASKF